MKTVDGTQKLCTVLQPSKTSPKPYSAGCAPLPGSLLPALCCFSNSLLFWQHLNTILEKGPQSRHQLLHGFSVYNTVIHVFLTGYLKQEKKKSPNWSKLLHSVKKPHSRADNCSAQLLSAEGNGLQIFTRQNMLTGSCLVLLLTIAWK